MLGPLLGLTLGKAGYPTSPFEQVEYLKKSTYWWRSSIARLVFLLRRSVDCTSAWKRLATLNFMWTATRKAFSKLGLVPSDAPVHDDDNYKKKEVVWIKHTKQLVTNVSSLQNQKHPREAE
eukprot:s548_g18.t1